MSADVTTARLAAPSTTFSPLPLLRRAINANRSLLTSVGSLGFGFLLWEIAADLIVRDKLFLVAPSAVVVRIAQLLGTGELQHHIVASGLEFVIGFVIAAFVGVGVGLLMGTCKPARIALTPWVAAIYSTPLIALSPLLILWFGIGITSKVVVVFAVSVFPVLVNTQTGIEGADERLLEMARAFGANTRQTFTKVLLPAAVPFIVAGLRLGVGRGLVGVVAAELFGAREGLGFLITAASQVFDMGALFGAVVILALAGVLSTAAIRALEQRIAPWRGA
ncbi:MAG: NitT/TauT family transport system permease protein [Chloroflexota bacterium]|jgi:NitT/TauT family transport system permease protein|nr:NitT/TauT family transport system permease protein [Chloroflexota bacterium]